MSASVRVELPAGLCQLARIGRQIMVRLEGCVTQRAVLDALEADYPVLRGTIRDQATGRRRPFIRFFACQEDFSHTAPDTPLPPAVAAGVEVFMVVGAIAGG